jgi:hypothetical protein
MFCNSGGRDATHYILYQDCFVEVDVVMDANTPLWKAHDLSQQLQDKIEGLPNVERAFVHVDHETTHHPVCSSRCSSPARNKRLIYHVSGTSKVRLDILV